MKRALRIVLTILISGGALAYILNIKKHHIDVSKLRHSRFLGFSIK